MTLEYQPTICNVPEPELNITQIKATRICPECGLELRDDGGCLFCYCGFSLCGWGGERCFGISNNYCH